MVAASSPYAQLWPWERATIPAAALDPVPLPAFLTVSQATLQFAFVALLTVAWLQQPGWLIVLLPLARASALDLHYRILPDVYQIPLLLLGCGWRIVHAETIPLLQDVGLMLVLLGFLYTVIWFSPRGNEFGFGDAKLLLLLAVWFGGGPTMLIICLALLLSVPLSAALRPYAAPFGPGLFLALCGVLALGF